MTAKKIGFSKNTCLTRYVIRNVVAADSRFGLKGLMKRHPIRTHFRNMTGANIVNFRIRIRTMNQCDGFGAR